MSWRRTEPEPSLFPLPPRMPEYRRVNCACGCGLWFYAARLPGRPPAYVSREHTQRARNHRRAVLRRWVEAPFHPPFDLNEVS